MKIDEIMKNKKVLISIVIVLVVIIVGLVIFIPEDSIINIKSAESNLKITESVSSKIELVDYVGDNFTMKIPKGWTVETGGTGILYAVRVYDKLDTRNQIYISLKAMPFMKSYKAREWWKNYTKVSNNYYNSKLWTEAVILDPATTLNFYKEFNNYADFAKKYEATYSNFNFPFLSSFKSIEEFDSNTLMKKLSLDDKTIRATFENEEGKTGEGLFMATLVSVGSYYVENVDTLHNVAYNVIFVSSAENEFINYEKVLTESLKTFVYKESFINTTIQNIQEQTDAALKANATVQSAYDSYNSAWSARQKNYDITSQKYSDATLGYERVYDTDTGEIYKAYNGFTDDYKGKKYQIVTDNMYTESISGYIDKIN